MTTYRFRLRFLLSEGVRIQDDGTSLEIDLPASEKRIVLKASIGDPPPPLKETTNLVLIGGDFSSEEEAYRLGQQVKQALLISSTKLQLGVNIGKDRSTLQFSQFMHDNFRENGYNLLPDVHGLMVYPEEPTPMVVNMSAKAVIGKSAVKFREAFTGAYEAVSANELGQRKLLALELYNLSHFETSLPARFVTLVSAVECISRRAKQAQDVIAHIASLSEETKLHYHGADKESLLSRLGDLKRESISVACGRLMRLYLGNEAADEFSRLYRIRCDIVHEGEAPNGVDLGTDTPRLDTLVSELLVAIAVSRQDQQMSQDGSIDATLAG